MKHPDEIKKVLKAASLSEASELDEEQLERAKTIASSKSKTATGPALANFIMKGGKGGTRAGKGGRVPGKMSMNEAATAILKRARGPMHAKDIAKRALDQGLIESKGATPEQTMAARLATGAKKGDFKRTAPNTFTLPTKSAPAKKPKAKAKATA